MSVRTRFAPSPTGYLHIGGARTALFNWLYARKHGGAFILRIEDTDRERSTRESVNAILESLAWLGLDYDEGPYFQSERFDRYRQVIQRLLDEGQAYYCYCTKEELEAMRQAQLMRKEKPRYDGRCRYRSAPRPGVEAVVRFRNPQAGEVVIEDLVRGRVVFSNQELDDLILARSDGTPTYNLTVVVDDLDMGITHVIRGDDHLSNTPRQINILRALGAEPPRYAHVPMILGEDGTRLSKRHGAVSVLEYRDQGYLPEALLNYLVRLGWAHGDQEVFSIDEMIHLFDIAEVNKSASTFNPAKLLWLNHHYLMHSNPLHVAHHLRWHLGRLGIDPDQGPDIIDLVLAFRERTKTLLEMAENGRVFYQDFTEYDAQAAEKYLTAEALPALQALYERFQGLGAWEQDKLHQVVLAVAEAFGQKLGKIAQPLRVALTGTSVSPPIDVTLYLLGREKTLTRMVRAIAYILDKEREKH